MEILRDDKRKNNELRNVILRTNYTIYAEGSVLIEMGNTKVICTASVVDKVPHFLRKSGKGWLTAEYSMLPRSTDERNMRESVRGKIGGRTMEIQRLIGRSLRTCIDLKAFGENTITIDCDVIQADGGTRVASITGGYIALAIAIERLLTEKKIEKSPLLCSVAAISVGIVNGIPMTDLKFSEDSNADVDMNIIMNSNNEFVEIQGTGEKTTFSRDQLNALLDLGEKAINELFEIQNRAIEESKSAKNSDISKLSYVDKNKNINNGRNL